MNKLFKTIIIIIICYWILFGITLSTEAIESKDYQIKYKEYLDKYIYKNLIIIADKYDDIEPSYNTEIRYINTKQSGIIISNYKNESIYLWNDCLVDVILPIIKNSITCDILAYNGKRYTIERKYLKYPPEARLYSHYNNDKQSLLKQQNKKKQITKNTKLSKQKNSQKDILISTHIPVQIHSSSKGIYAGKFQLTAYAWTGNRCANGQYPKKHYTVAAHKSDFPMGTKLYIEGYGIYTVEDRGGFPPKVIDIYIGDTPSCIKFGRKYNVNVYILSYGNSSRSKK